MVPPSSPLEASPDGEEIEVGDEDLDPAEARRLRKLKLEAKKERADKRAAAKEAWDAGRADRVQQAIAARRQEEEQRAERVAKAAADRRTYEAGREDRIAKKMELRRIEESTRADRVAKKAEARRAEEANRPLMIALAAASRRAAREEAKALGLNTPATPASPQDEEDADGVENPSMSPGSPNGSPSASGDNALPEGVRILKEKMSDSEGEGGSDKEELELTVLKEAPAPIRRVVDEALAEDVSREKFDKETAQKEKDFFTKINNDLNKSTFRGIQYWHESAQKQERKAHKKERKLHKKLKKQKKKMKSAIKKAGKAEDGDSSDSGESMDGSDDGPDRKKAALEDAAAPKKLDSSALSALRGIV